MSTIHDLNETRAEKMSKKIRKSPSKNQTEGFTLEEAFGLITLAVVKKKEFIDMDAPQALNIGVVSGLLTINEEVEVVVKFFDRVDQLTKREFEKMLRLTREI